MNRVFRSIWNDTQHTWVAAPETSKTQGRRSGRGALTTGAATAAALITFIPPVAEAQVVNACTGISLPPSVVTGIISASVVPVLSSIAALPAVGGLVSLTGLTTELSTIAAGNPISLAAVTTGGTVLGPGAACNIQASSFTLSTAQGISIGGNQITGLGGGTAATAGEINSVAFGNGAVTNATASSSIAIGPNAAVGAGANGSVALGSAASASAANSVALGAGSVASTGALTGYTAYGLSTAQTSVGEVSVGASGSERQITNVAAGSAATDAVNVEQLQGAISTATSSSSALGASVATALGGGSTYNPTAGTVSAPSYTVYGASQNNVGSAIAALQNGAPVQYSSTSAPTTPLGAATAPTTNDVTLVGPIAGAPVALHNVAPGLLTAASTDAVNGSQLNTTNLNVAANTSAITAAGTVSASLGTSTATNLGGGSTYNPATGVVSAPSYTVYGASQNNVGSAIAALQNNAPLQYSSAAAPTTGIGATGTPTTNDVTLVGPTAGAPVALHNLAPGLLTATSTDAVNGSQLYATNQAVAADTSSISSLQSTSANAVTYDTSAHTSITLGGVGSTTPVTVTNLAAGALSATSTDAVNGSQLYATNSTLSATSSALGGLGTGLASSLGGGAAYNAATGAFTAPSYSVYGAPQGNVGAAIAALQNNAPVQYSSVAAPTTGIGATGTPSSNDVTLVGPVAGAPVALHNVAAGVISATSTDAVNGSQLFMLGQTVAGNTAAISTLQNLSSDAVAYDSTAHTSVTLGGVGATTEVALTNVAAGAITATSSDAVNGSQLFTVTGELSTLQSELASLSTGTGTGTGALAVNNSAGANGVAPVSNVAAASGPDSVATGAGAVASGTDSEANGNNATASGAGSTANGAQSLASGPDSTAEGYGSQATQNGATAVGAGAKATGYSSTALGDHAGATGANATAVGENASAIGANSVALGAGSVANTANTVSIGSPGNERTLSNLAPGTQGTDAANMNQLWSMQSGIQNSINSVAGKAYGGVAGATALTMIPEADPGKVLAVGLGVGSYGGYTASAIGATVRITENLKAKVGASLGSTGSTYGGGVAYQW